MVNFKRILCFLLILTILPIYVIADENDEELILPNSHAYIITKTPKDNHSYEDVVRVGGKGEDCSRGYVFFNFSKNIMSDDKYVLELTPDSLSAEKVLNIYGYKYPDRTATEIVGESVSVVTTQIGSVTLVNGDTAFLDVTDYVKNNITIRNNVAFVLVGDDKIEAYFDMSDNGIVLKKSKDKTPKRDFEVVDINNLQIGTETSSGSSTGKESPDVTDNNYERAKQIKEVAWPKIPDYPDYVDIDDYTTTYYKPWVLNYHLTEPHQIENDYFGGETGQRILSGDISYQNNNTLLIGYDTEGIYRSDDGGVTWYPSQDGLKTVTAVSIAFHPDDDNIAFAMTAQVNNGYSKNIGMFKSVDGGRNWYQVHNMPSHYGYHYELITFNEKLNKNGYRTIYAGTLASGAVISSQDNGETWTDIGLEGKSVTALHYADGMLIAATKDGVFVTTDEGVTWEARNNGLDGPYIDEDDPSLGRKCEVYSLTIDPDRPTDWYCGLGTDLYVTRDKGLSWEYMTDCYELMGVKRFFYNLKFGAKYPDGHRRLFATLHGQYSYRFSDDYGVTWQNEIIHNEEAFFEDNWGSAPQPLIASRDNPDLMWVMMQDENYKSVDGGANIYPSASGCSGHRLVDFWVNPQNPNDMIMGSTDYGVVFTLPTDRGEDFPMVTNYSSEDKFWIRYSGSRSVHGVDVDPRDRNRIIISIGGWNKSILKESTDGGLSFNVIPGSEGSNAFVKFNNQNPDVIYSGQRASYDNGKTWNTLEFAIKGIHPLNNNIVYTNAAGGIRKSTDCGRTWTVMSPGVMNAQSITPDFENEDKLYVGSLANGVAIVENGKVTFKDKDDGLGTSLLGTNAFYYVVQDPSNAKHLVTCGQDQVKYSKSAGIYESFDGGNTWKHVEGLPGSGDTWFVYYHPTQQKVYIATSNGTFVYLPERYYDMSKYIYTDVQNEQDSYAVNEIERLYNEGISNQYTDGYFEPKSTVRRHEIVDYLYKILGIENKYYKQVFEDVDLFSRHYVASTALFEMGVLEMDADCKLDPYEEVTYGELYKMITKIFRAKGMCNDIKMLDPLGSTKNALYVCQNKGLLKNVQVTDANSIITRENMAVIMCNLMDVLK